MWRIINESGLTRIVIERAIQVNVEDICRFFKDFSSLPVGWLYHNLLFHDEVGFDNRDMFRKRGYRLRGKRIHHRCEFTRKPTCSLLCFLGRSGMLETFCTEGTFDRYKFIYCCRKLVQSGEIYPYPGRHSVWIMDGASIH